LVDNERRNALEGLVRRRKQREELLPGRRQVRSQLVRQQRQHLVQH
jgi:hypothetical protein